MSKIDPPWEDSAPFAAEMAAMKRKLRGIMLPRVAFDHVALREAIMTLSTSSKLRGLTVNVDVEPSFEGVIDQTVPGTPDNPWISYTARKVSLWDALNAVARSGQFIVRVAPYGVTLKKPEPLGELTTHEYIPPPQFFTPDPKPSAAREEWKRFLSESRDPEQANPREWLVGSRAPGMGKSLLYIVRRNRLIVRNTAEYHRKVAELIEKGWREYYASDEWKKRKKR